MCGQEYVINSNKFPQESCSRKKNYENDEKDRSTSYFLSPLLVRNSGGEIVNAAYIKKAPANF
jgi:hypothetical protein